MDKREARKEYKSKITPKGIFAVRCSVSGEVWVGSSTHLDSEMNGMWFQLRSGVCRNKTMQAAWNAHGEGAFGYEVLETFAEDVSPLLIKELFAARLKVWAGMV